jgi:hypothetical protein
MQQEVQPTSARPVTGRAWVWLASLAMFGGLAAMVIQLFVLKRLEVPWYMAALGIVGVVLMAAALWQRFALVRGLVFVAFVALAALEWYVLLVFVRLPAYAGPARVGDPVPAFTSTLADGSPLSDRDLRGGRSVLLFFRGRW